MCGFALRPIFIRLAYTYTTDPVTLLALRMIFSLPFFVLIVTPLVAAAALWYRRRLLRELKNLLELKRAG